MAEISDTSILPAQSDVQPRQPGHLRDLIYLVGVSWLRPQRAAQRCTHWPLAVCFLVHVGIGLAGLFLVAGGLSVFEGSVDHLFLNIKAEFSREPAMFILWSLGILLLVEAAMLGLAVVGLAWGALAHERLRDSLRHSLRQVWLRTPHALVISVFIAAAITTIEIKSQQWRHEHPSPWSSAPMPSYPVPPSMAEDDPAYRAAMAKYEQEMADYQAEMARRQQSWGQWWPTQPWYVRNEGPMSIAMVIVGAGWWLAAMLCAFGVRRSPGAVERAPRCLTCGYDLSMTPADSRCPECGEEVIKSLGELAQPGAAWEWPRAQVHILGAWWRTCRTAVRRPSSFGRSLRLFDERTGYRGYFIIHLALIFLLGAGGILTVAFTSRGSTDAFVLVLISSIVGTMCAMGATLVACGVASIVGVVISLQNKRNLLLAAMQVAAYASPFLVAWAFFGAMLIVSFINLNEYGWARVIADRTGLPIDFLAFLWLAVPNIVCSLLYIAIVARGTRGARFANR